MNAKYLCVFCILLMNAGLAKSAEPDAEHIKLIETLKSKIKPESIRYDESMPDKPIIYLSCSWEYFPLIGASPKLRSLDLRQGGTSKKIEDFQVLEKLTLLERFSFYDYKQDSSWMKYLEGHSLLKTLNLTNTSISDEDMIHISKLYNLTTLYLGNAGISDNGLKYIINLQKLEILYLVGNNISDEGLDYIIHITSLRKIELGGTKITDKGIYKIADNLDKLTELTLSGTAITEKAVQIISDKLNSLSVLGVQGSAITDSALDDIMKMKNLKILDIRGTKITYDGVQTLAKALRASKTRVESNWSPID
jgi:Ran GTPase-activating protein (RanGAP) involved in mRNA processing and transport